MEHYQKTQLKYLYILISQSFSKPYGIYDDIDLAKKECNHLTERMVGACIYKTIINKNIVSTKDYYTLVYDNGINMI